MAPPFQRWLAKAAEKLAGRYYEGREPPVRLAAMAEAFAGMHPRATRGEWLDMAKELAAEAYRSGYRAGYEKYDRDPENEREQFDPDELAGEPDWEWGGPTTVEQMAEVPDDDEGQSLSLEDQADYLALREQYEREQRMGRGPGRR